MAKSDLLKEAIADARAVKETAIANAKIALQEAFAPRIQSMLGAKLAEQMEDEEAYSDEEEMLKMNKGMDMPDELAGPDEMGAEPGMENEPGMEADGDFTWTDDRLSATVGGQDYDFQVGMAGAGEEDLETAPEDQMPKDDEMSDETEEFPEDDQMDDDLAEIIRELEEGLYEQHETYDDEPKSPKKGLGEMDDPSPAEKGDGFDLNEDIDAIIEAILAEEESDMHDRIPRKKTADTEAEDEKEAELQEAYRTIHQLRAVINEVNLLNAKLLYTNKLFRNHELNEAQKMKVIENFDRAGTTREVKLVFSTLAESLKKPAQKRRVVKESYASKPAPSTMPSKETRTQILSEGNELANRWKKLAGLV